MSANRKTLNLVHSPEEFSLIFISINITLILLFKFIVHELSTAASLLDAKSLLKAKAPQSGNGGNKSHLECRVQS